ncbi:hypothetical protein ACQPZJ_14995 [Actinoplanes sp. CA-054009]
MVDAESIRALLIGATVRSLGRATGMGVLELVGAGDEVIGVHLQCPFRVQRSDAVIIGSRDMNFPLKGRQSEAFDNFATVFDDRAGRLTAILGQRRPVVENVLVDKLGNLVIAWNPDYSLNAFVDTSGRVESWRVLIRGGEHYVFPGEHP